MVICTVICCLDMTPNIDFYVSVFLNIIAVYIQYIKSYVKDRIDK